MAHSSCMYSDDSRLSHSVFCVLLFCRFCVAILWFFFYVFLLFHLYGILGIISITDIARCFFVLAAMLSSHIKAISLRVCFCQFFGSAYDSFVGPKQWCLFIILFCNFFRWSYFMHCTYKCSVACSYIMCLNQLWCCNGAVWRCIFTSCCWLFARFCCCFFSFAH